MSWKAVELQVALPRTQDAGQLQDQLQQRAQVMQDVLSEEQLKELERKRKAVLESNESEPARNENDNHSNNGWLDDSKQRSSKETNQQIPHPYLGNRVDLSR